jgi:hypothetical protein
MSAARRKGNILETAVAQRLHIVDGVDPKLAGIQTPTGRMGNTYRLQIDVASQNWAAECKNREDNPKRLWTWLDQIEEQAGKVDKAGILVVKRNFRRPLVVMDAETFYDLIDRRPW